MFLYLDVDDEYEDEEDQWEEGAEDILEKGGGLIFNKEVCLNNSLILYQSHVAFSLW